MFLRNVKFEVMFTQAYLELSPTSTMQFFAKYLTIFVKKLPADV